MTPLAIVLAGVCGLAQYGMSSDVDPRSKRLIQWFLFCVLMFVLVVLLIQALTDLLA